MPAHQVFWVSRRLWNYMTELGFKAAWGESNHELDSGFVAWDLTVDDFLVSITTRPNAEFPKLRAC